MDQSTAASLDKVTDRVADQAVDASGASEDLTAALQAFADAEAAKKADKAAELRRRLAVAVADEDVEVMQSEFGLSKKQATTALQEAGGDLQAALSAFIVGGIGSVMDAKDIAAASSAAVVKDKISGGSAST